MNIKSLRLFMLSLSILSLQATNDYRKVEVENDSDYSMHIMSNAADLKIDHSIPSRTHAKVSVEAKSTRENKMLRFPEKALLQAIIKNSPIEVIKAIEAGARVNDKINGKKPLSWAILFEHATVAKYLVQYGAIL